MPLQSMDVPKRTREGKYNYDEGELDAAAEMLANDEYPGDGGFDTPGQARSAAFALINQLERHDESLKDKLGSKVWGSDEEGYSFAVKTGRKQYSKK